MARKKKEAPVFDLAPEPAPEPQPEPAPVDDAFEAQLGVLMAAEQAGIPWSELRNSLTDVIRAVANGTVRATAAQVSMIKHVIEQAKTAEQDGKAQVRNVVLLPVQGAGANLTFAEAARARVAALEAKPNA